MKNTFKKNSYARGEMWIAFLVLFGVISSSFTSSQAAAAEAAASASASFRDSLTSEPVRSTLVRLHKEAEVADKPLAESYADDYADPAKRSELIKRYVERRQ
jgi:hypothetical protein